MLYFVQQYLYFTVSEVHLLRPLGMFYVVRNDQHCEQASVLLPYFYHIWWCEGVSLCKWVWSTSMSTAYSCICDKHQFSCAYGWLLCTNVVLAMLEWWGFTIILRKLVYSKPMYIYFISTVMQKTVPVSSTDIKLLCMNQTVRVIFRLLTGCYFQLEQAYI